MSEYNRLKASMKPAQITEKERVRTQVALGDASDGVLAAAACQVARQDGVRLTALALQAGATWRQLTQPTL